MPISPDVLHVGSAYTRKTLSTLFERSDIATSREGPYIRDDEVYGIYFVTLDKSNAEPNIAYDDYFSDGSFFWESQSRNTRESKIIRRLEADEYTPLLFVREFAKVKGVTEPFIYAGRLANPVVNPKSSKPVKIVFEPIDIPTPAPAQLQPLIDWLPDEAHRGADSDDFKKRTRAKKAAFGQGWESDSEIRKAIEAHAMQAAIEHYSALLYKVEDTSANRPYDLVCTKNGQRERRVEVKGTRGQPNNVFVTIGEVKAVRNDGVSTDLFILYGILSERTVKGISAHGGQVHLLEDWSPNDADLEPTQFRYSVPSTA